MAGQKFRFDDLDEASLVGLALCLAEVVDPGDVFCLNGPVGAGKTTFARALIKAILVVDEDVPSPTFTLVQTYDTRRGPVWHADLYRLGSSVELEELGLTEAFETAICLVEWPELMNSVKPATAHELTFESALDGAARQLTICTLSTRLCQTLESFSP